VSLGIAGIKFGVQLMFDWSGVSFFAIASFHSKQLAKYGTRTARNKVRTRISTGIFTKYNGVLFYSQI